MTARQIGGAVGVALLVALLTAGGNPYDRFVESWWISGGIAAATAISALWLIPKGVGNHALGLDQPAAQAAAVTPSSTDETASFGNIAAPQPPKPVESAGSGF
jgi:hypothetical protein